MNNNRKALPLIKTGASMVFKHLINIAVADRMPDSDLHDKEPYE